MATFYVCTDCGQKTVRKVAVCLSCSGTKVAFGGDLTSLDLGRRKPKPKQSSNQFQNLLVLALALTAVFYACQFALNPVKRQLGSTQVLTP